MLRLAADENFDGRISAACFAPFPTWILSEVQDTPLAEADDATVLEWAAQENRVVLTHDASTMTAAAWLV